MKLKQSLLVAFSLLYLWFCEEPDTTLPVLSITHPISNAIISDSTTILVDANDNIGVGSVEFYINDSLHFIDTEMPWAFTWHIVSPEPQLIHHIYCKAFDLSGNTGVSDTIEVTIQAESMITIEEPTIEFGAELNTLQLYFWVSGNEALTWEASPIAPWISVLPDHGSTSSGLDSLEIQISRENLTPGDYSSDVSINWGTGSCKFSISMTVLAIGSDYVSPQVLDFGTSVDTLRLTVHKFSADTLVWTLVSLDPWIVFPRSGGVTYNALDSIDVLVSRENLEFGEYSGEIILVLGQEQITINVSMAVIETPILIVSQDQFNFGSQTNSLNIDITNGGLGVLAWWATPTESWITISPNDDVCSTDTNHCQIYLSRSSMQIGEQSGSILFSSNGGEQTVQVVATVEVSETENPNTYQIETTPPGATIYFDGTNMNLTTPGTIDYLTEGSHQVRLYLEGYNEVTIPFYHVYDEEHSVQIPLALPEYPLPIFTSILPNPGTSFNDNVVSVSGTIEIDDGFGNRTIYDEEIAILTLNGVDQVISVINGNLNQVISIASGDNTVNLRANSSDGNTGISEALIIYGNFDIPDIEVTLTWNTPTSDLDLHIWNPEGEHCYFANMSTTDGFLDIDDVEGFGPEIFTAENAILGGYVLMVNSYTLDQDAFADATIQIRLNGGPIATYGPHPFDVEDQMGSDPNAWWEVTTFYSNTSLAKSTGSTVPVWLYEKVASDIKNLSRK